jgi:GNAT superfamily N-acetyltransferase
MSGCSDRTSSNGGAARRSGRSTSPRRAPATCRVYWPTKGSPLTWPCWATSRSATPSPTLAFGSGDGWWEGETDPGVRGIDQSLAAPELLDRGLGTQLVTALVERLFADPEVSRIQTDPAPANLRAIRCYEKAGFRRLRTIVTPDGPAEYMVRDRPEKRP